MYQCQQIEAPQEINCLQRFNIHQEVVIAALYRAVTSFGFLRLGHIDPSAFYLGCLFALWAFGVVCMFLAAFLGSGKGFRGIAAGITVVALAYANIKFWTRIWNHPPLRENFGMPFVLLQVCAFVCSLLTVSDLQVPNKYPPSKLQHSMLASFWPCPPWPKMPQPKQTRSLGFSCGLPA